MSGLNSLEGFRDRFWYWRGKSGTRYIHSIYSPDNCPPLPGAIFVMVQKLANGKRVALDVGRFSENWDYVEGSLTERCGSLTRIDEIHVHLLAPSDDGAEGIVRDLVNAIGPRSIVRSPSVGPKKRSIKRKKFSGFQEENASAITQLRSPALKPKLNPVPNWQLGLFDDQRPESVLASA